MLLFFLSLSPLNYWFFGCLRIWTYYQYMFYVVLTIETAKITPNTGLLSPWINILYWFSFYFAGYEDRVCHTNRMLLGSLEAPHRYNTGFWPPWSSSSVCLMCMDSDCPERVFFPYYLRTLTWLSYSLKLYLPARDRRSSTILCHPGWRRD